MPTSPLLAEIPEGINDLFHYTDAGGLLGMVQFKKLWLTSIHYQNDSEEYYYAFNLVKDILINEYFSLAVDSLETSEDRMSTVFSFSFSEEKDLLSQWRGYCPNGGFAISFDREELNKIIRREELTVAKCVYDKSEQRDFIINNIIGFTPEQYLEAVRQTRVTDTPRMHYICKYLLEDVRRLSPLLKHSSFSGEKEWRIFKKVQTSSEAKLLSDSARNYIPANTIKIRSRKNFLIPYIEVPLDEGSATVNIKEVVISPTPHKSLALDACKVLLYGDRVTNYNAQVENSTIPYVNW